MHTANDLNRHTQKGPNFDITDAILPRKDDVGILNIVKIVWENFVMLKNHHQTKGLKTIF